MDRSSSSNNLLIIVALAVAAASAFACERRDGDGDADADSDADGDADGDTDADADGDGDADAHEEPPELTAEAEAALDALVEGLSASVALGAPLVQDGEGLRDDPSSGTDGSSRDSTARDRVENGVARDSIVTDRACVIFDWSRLTATITFTGCTLEQTGESLDGVMALSVSFGPVVFSMTFDDLTIGETTLDGTVAMSFGGLCREGDPECIPCTDSDPECAEAQENQKTLTADLTIVSSSTFSLTLEGLEVVISDACSTTVSGAGSTSSESITGDLTLTDVLFETGDCLPTSGTIVLDDGSALTTTITFLPTTPETGEVNVQIGPFPAAPVPLFPPCSA